MSSRLLQILCVALIAIGVGLLVAGNSLHPAAPTELLAATSALSWSPRHVQFYVELSATLKGVGAGFLTLGLLGLLVPWINTLVHGRRGPAVGRPSSGETIVPS